MAYLYSNGLDWGAFLGTVFRGFACMKCVVLKVLHLSHFHPTIRNAAGALAFELDRNDVNNLSILMDWWRVDTRGNVEMLKCA